MLHKDHDYIACQGPLQSTSEDFWDMILQYGVKKIVMLTKIHEQNPNDPSQFKVSVYVCWKPFSNNF